jgi:hypothetical protein
MKRWRGNQRNAPGIFRLIRTDRRFGGALEADCAWRGGICGHGSIRRASLSRRDGRSPSRSCALTAMLNLQCIWSVLFCSAASDSHSLAMHAVASEIQMGNHLWTQIEKREKMALNSANSEKKKRSLGQLTLQVQESHQYVLGFRSTASDFRVQAWHEPCLPPHTAGASSSPYSSPPPRCGSLCPRTPPARRGSCSPSPPTCRTSAASPASSPPVLYQRTPDPLSLPHRFVREPVFGYLTYFVLRSLDDVCGLLPSIRDQVPGKRMLECWWEW